MKPMIALLELLKQHAQQTSLDTLHCAPDIKARLEHDPDVLHHKPVTGDFAQLLAVDIMEHEDYPPGRWVLISNGQAVASSDDDRTVTGDGVPDDFPG